MTDLTFTRSITFNVLGSKGAPSTKVTVVEDGEGNLDFTLDVLNTGKSTSDLRGLFFNLVADERERDLVATGQQVSGFDSQRVIDLGGGANMRGLASPFDFGVAFGGPGIGKNGEIWTTSFELADQNGWLTLDDIANVDFGVRLTGGFGTGNSKPVSEAPAAPDALNDIYTIFEDGQASLDDATHTPDGVLFQVLDNDTDADQDVLRVVAIRGVQHGSVEIVDGDDADTLIGDAVLYTPDADYAGTDSFEYAITDDAGGTDFARVDVAVTAVADVPQLSYEVLAGSSTEEVIIRVTAVQTDLDASEYIDRIELSGIPDDVSVTPASVNPGTTLGTLVQEFTLTLPLDKSTVFDLGITAVSKEFSNGDEQTTVRSVPIRLEYTENDYELTFAAQDQSIWSAGDAFVFTDDRFIGVDNTGNPLDDSDGGLIGYRAYAAIKAGLQSNLVCEGGAIDATLDYDFAVDTNYNKTTDMLLITSSQLLTGGYFTTEGPSGSYKLDFIFNYDIEAAITYDIELDEGDIVGVDISANNTLNILDLDSENLSLSIPFPAPFGSVTADLAWPNIDTSSFATGTEGLFSATGNSNDFLSLNIDLDQALADAFLSGFNPFDLPGINVGVAGVDLDLMDADIFGGISLLQEFALQAQGVTGVLLFEDGSEASFVFGEEIELSNASMIDAGGNNNGQVEFILALDAQADLNNDTDLAFDMGYNFDIFTAHWWYDVELASDSGTIGPLYDGGASFGISTVGVYDNTFDLNFAAQQVTFAA